MQESVEHQVESVIQYRKRLKEVENRRGRYLQNVPAEIWQELAEVSRGLEKAEQKVRQTSRELAGETNQIRIEIISTLERYNHWRDQMRQVEGLFLANIIRPGFYLKQAIYHREYLSQEYDRILTRIQRAGYASQEELDTDIRQVLTYGDITFDEHEKVSDEELLQDGEAPSQFDEVNVDNLVEAISREELVKQFKRVVLPRIHPDTSNTPVEVFKTVYEVYEKGDKLLMEAYIIDYQGEIQPDEETDPLECLDQVQKEQRRYHRLSTHLQRRVDRLKQDLTTQEMEEPGKIQETMHQQRQEILTRIQSEAEQILYWRDKIEGLVQEYRLRYEQAEGEN